MAGRMLTKVGASVLRVQLARGVCHYRPRIGNRDIVGHGVNGMPNYADRSDFPMPAIRFKENTPDVMVLREKEKADWRKLTKEEKKALYRASFCQTFAEFQAPSGQWKSYVGAALALSSLSLWMLMFFRHYVLPPLPESFQEDHRKAQLKRMLDMKINPVDGLSSKWDYENNRWK